MRPFFGVLRSSDVERADGIECDRRPLHPLDVLVAFVLMSVMVEWTSRMGQGVMFDLRTRIFGHLQRADIAVFDRTPVGRLMTRLTTDVDALNELFTSGFVALLGDVVVLGGIVAILFALNPPLAAVTFGILLPMPFVTNWFRKGARDTYRDVRVRIARVNAFLQEHLSGILVVQLFRREKVATQGVLGGQRRAPRREHRVHLLLLGLLPRARLSLGARAWRPSSGTAAGR